MAKRKLSTRIKNLSKDFFSKTNVQLRNTILLSLTIIGTDGLLGFFPDNWSNLFKIMIGVVGSVLVIYGYEILKDWNK